MKTIATWHVRMLSQCMALAMLLLCSLQGLGQLYIDGRQAMADTQSNILLYTIPRECFGHDFTAIVQVDTTSQWSNISVNGQSLSSNPITFGDVEAGKSYLVRAIVAHRPAVFRLQFTFLPIMNLQGDFGNDYSAATVTLLEPGAQSSQDMGALVKWRGGYTNGAGRHKRNYSIKFVDENGEKQNHKLLGMRRDNHWKLDAAQVDRSRVRNRVATDLWLDMATEPYYIDQAPDALMGARGKPVEVFASGAYMGIYHLLECVDRKQVQVRKWDEDTEQTYGMMWNTTRWSDVTAFKRSPYYNNNSNAYDNFVVEYPDFDDVHPTHHEHMYNAVFFMANSSVAGFNSRAHTYFDMPVVIDYAILNQLLTSIDNEVNNIYWVIYDRLQDRKLTIAVWDLDWSLGTDRNSPTFRGERAMPTYDFEFSSRVLNMLQDPRCIYHKPMVLRYWQLRHTWLSLESLASRVNNAVEPLVASGAVLREQARWSGDSDINGLPLDIVAEKDYIIDWIGERLSFLDRTLMRQVCDVNGDGGITVADVTTIVTHLLDKSSSYDAQLDVDGDGHITINDLNIAYSIILGLN